MKRGNKGYRGGWPGVETFFRYFIYDYNWPDSAFEKCISLKTKGSLVRFVYLRSLE
jgi:hypothetical protein